jgi:hypothetical protein
MPQLPYIFRRLFIFVEALTNCFQFIIQEAILLQSFTSPVTVSREQPNRAWLIL